jgi:hypothetical protein
MFEQFEQKILSLTIRAAGPCFLDMDPDPTEAKFLDPQLPTDNIIYVRLWLCEFNRFSSRAFLWMSIMNIYFKNKKDRFCERKNNSYERVLIYFDVEDEKYFWCVLEPDA